MNVGSVSAFWAGTRPDSDAVRTGGSGQTWSEFDRVTTRQAAGLSAVGVRPGDRVGILAGNSLQWCQLTIAILKAGAVVVPLNVRLAPDEVRHIVADAGCRAVACDRPLSPVFDAAFPKTSGHDAIVRLGLCDADGDVAVADLDGDPTQAWPAQPDDPAIIAYTSGTTGLPKGVVLSHANLFAQLVQKSVSDGWGYQERTLLCLPLCFTGGIINNFLTTFLVGGTLLLESTFEPVRALQLLTEERATVLMGVPVMFQGLAGAPGFDEADLSSLRTALAGGSPVPEGLLRTYQAKGVAIRQAYGLTEAGGFVAQLPAHLAVSKPRSIGVPHPMTQVRVVGADARDVAAGEPGEIWVRGPQVMSGYWNNPEATSAAFAGHWLRTGDVGRFDSDGMLEVVDRLKDLIISGGLNVYPAEVERVAADYPGVADVGAFGIPDERWGEVVIVAVYGNGVDPDKLIAHCRAKIADYKSPRTVVVHDTPLPRSTSGKVLRHELRALWEASQVVEAGAHL
jgi:fatty-acyl-CoA synthase